MSFRSEWVLIFSKIRSLRLGILKTSVMKRNQWVHFAFPIMRLRFVPNPPQLSLVTHNIHSTLTFAPLSATPPPPPESTPPSGTVPSVRLDGHV